MKTRFDDFPADSPREIRQPDALQTGILSGRGQGNICLTFQNIGGTKKTGSGRPLSTVHSATGMATLDMKGRTRKMSSRNVMTAAGRMLIILSILVGCAADHPKAVFRGYYGIEPPESTLAELDLGAAYEVIIDDMYYVSQAKHGSVRLPAGDHRIKWAVVFGVSVMVDARGYAAYDIISNIKLEAGHRYRLSADRTTGHGYKVFFWIEDMTTGKIVYGEKKP